MANESVQLTIGQMIKNLDKIDGNLPIYLDYNRKSPSGVISWQGAFDDLSIEYDGEPLNVENFRNILKSVLNVQSEDYKGGMVEFTENTDVWISNYGEYRIKEYKGLTMVSVAVVGIRVVNLFPSSGYEVIIDTDAMEY